MFTCGCWRIQELFGGCSEPACSFIASATGQRPVILFPRKKAAVAKKTRLRVSFERGSFF